MSREYSVTKIVYKPEAAVIMTTDVRCDVGLMLERES